MTKVKKPPVRVRFAPSPTGFLHIGSARSALFNWLFAKHHSDTFILRIEDTDKERSKPEYEQDIISGLEWLGVKWDEFYKQSERGKIYKKYLEKLLASGRAFWCRHTPEELEAEQSEQREKKEAPRHVCGFRSDQSLITNGQEGIIRLKIDSDSTSTREIVFEDIIRGRIGFEKKLLGDIAIAKDLDTPLYNFAAAIDDLDMKVSHVIRGEDHISNTPKQLAIFEALGVEPPRYAHLPLILGEDRSKLSKRHGATSVNQYKELGYLPEALVNFLGLLGWTPPHFSAKTEAGETPSEVFTKNQLIEWFSDLSKIHKSGAIFDIKKLNWLNAQYIKMENDAGLARLVRPFAEKHFGKQAEERVIKIAPLLRERLEYLDQVKEFHYFFKSPEYDADLLVWRKSDKAGAKKALELIAQAIPHGIANHELDEIAEKHFGGDRGAVYWPLRAALSGEQFSADPVQIAGILGPEETQNRVKHALSLL